MKIHRHHISNRLLPPFARGLMILLALFFSYSQIYGTENFILNKEINIAVKSKNRNLPSLDSLKIVLKVTPVGCGVLIGQIDLQISGGVPPYAIEWKGPISNFKENVYNEPCIIDLPRGSYTITIEDQDKNECIENVIINESNPTNFVPLIIEGGCDIGDALEIQILDGTPPYTLNWQIIGSSIIEEDVFNESNPILTPLAVGDYSVTVTDVNNCTRSQMNGMEIKNSGLIEDCEDIDTIIQNICIARDLAILKDFYNTGKVNDWTHNDNWGDTMVSLEEWFGVRLNEFGCVIGLDLDGIDDTDKDCGNILWNCLVDFGLPPPTGNNITGSFPDLNLVDLEVLNLSGNTLTEFPNISSLIGLEVLYLRYMGYTSTTSLSGFESLQAMKHMEITHSPNLSGNIPDFLYPDLRGLYLHDNQLTDSIPSFKNSPKLIQIHLANNNLEGIIPDFQQQNLSLLNLSGNKLTGIVPDFSTNKKIRNFIINDNELDSLPPNFIAIDKLVQCSVQYNQFTFDDIVPNMSYIPEWTYAPQDSIFVDTLINITVGTDLDVDLLIDANMATNKYEWFKNDILHITDTGNNHLFIPNIQLSDAGIYRVNITNPAAPKLKLFSRNIRIAIENNCLTPFTTNLAETLCDPIVINGLQINSDTIITKQLTTNFGCDSLINTEYTFSSPPIIDNQIITFTPNVSTYILLYDLIDCPDCISTILAIDASSFEEKVPTSNILKSVIYNNTCDAQQISVEVCRENCAVACKQFVITLNNSQDCEEETPCITQTNSFEEVICGAVEVNGVFINTDTLLIDTLMTDFGCDSIVQRKITTISPPLLERQIINFRPNASLNLSLYDLADCPDCSVTILDVSTDQIAYDNPFNNLLNCTITNTACDSLYISYSVSRNDCSEAVNTSIITLYNQQDCEIPYYFNPNEYNFIIPEIYNDEEKYPNYDLLIFNRWGGQVYHAAFYEPTGWDGTLNGNGPSLPDGNYFYILRLNTVENREEIGEVSIIR